MNDCSHFIWFYLFKSKDGTSHVFHYFLNMTEHRFQTKVLTIQTLGGGEFIPLVRDLGKMIIIHRFTYPCAS